VEWPGSEAASILEPFGESHSDDEANTMEGQQTTNTLGSSHVLQRGSGEGSILTDTPNHFRDSSSDAEGYTTDPSVNRCLTEGNTDDGESGTNDSGVDKPQVVTASSDDEGSTTEGPQTTNNLDCLSHVQWSSSEATSILELFCDSLSDDEANTMEGQQTTNALDSGVDKPKVVTASDTPKVTHPGNEHAEREPSTTQSSGGSSNKDKLVNSSNVSKAVIPGNNHTEHAHD
jgi:hypothetical protein